MVFETIMATVSILTHATAVAFALCLGLPQLADTQMTALYALAGVEHVTPLPLVLAASSIEAAEPYGKRTRMARRSCWAGQGRAARRHRQDEGLAASQAEGSSRRSASANPSARAARVRQTGPDAAQRPHDPPASSAKPDLYRPDYPWTRSELSLSSGQTSRMTSSTYSTP
jgi:hypothetical protein